MSTPHFSVIVPTYGRPDLLRKAVISVLSQTVEDLECIVVDDASPISFALPSDRRIRVIRRAVNGGPAAARNDGLAAAAGKFVAFLDDDDLWLPQRLQVIEEAVRWSPVTICWSRYIDGPATLGRALEGDVRDTILDGVTPSTGATVVRHDVVPKFDERFVACEDVEWWLRLGALATVTTVPVHAHLIRRGPAPRVRTGTEGRIAGNHLLLDTHSEYFRTHPVAEAFRWFRLGVTAAQAGEHNAALRALARAFRRRPSVRYAIHIFRFKWWRPRGGSYG